MGEHTVDQTGFVAEQVAHGDFAGGRAGCLAVGFQHFRAGEFRNVFRDRIFEGELAFFDQLHGRDRDDRLGHGVDAEDRLGRHRVGVVRAFRADGGDVDDLTALGDQQHGAGNAAGFDFSFEVSLGLVESSLVEAERSGIGGHRQRGLCRIGDGRRGGCFGDFRLGCFRGAGDGQRQHGGRSCGKEFEFVSGGLHRDPRLVDSRGFQCRETRRKSSVPLRNVCNKGRADIA